ncbi:MAG: radical SAM protein, partial [Candidatus Saelkia tenebricola]|nr:radical SAM protein [Candidatus Saelkia tenebricola]
MDKSLMFEVENVMETLVKTGISFCPVCERTIAAQLVNRKGYIYEQKECSWCNERFELLLAKASLTYRRGFDKIPNNWPQLNVKIGDIPGEESDIKNFSEVLYVLLNLTQRCNSFCRFCFEANEGPRPDMDIEFIKTTLKKFRNKIIVLFGGEPTMREDLPEII